MDDAEQPKGKSGAFPENQQQDQQYLPVIGGYSGQYCPGKFLGWNLWDRHRTLNQRYPVPLGHTRNAEPAKIPGTIDDAWPSDPWGRDWRKPRVHYGDEAPSVQNQPGVPDVIGFQLIPTYDNFPEYISIGYKNISQ